MVHVSDAVKHELKRVMIRTVVNDDAVTTVSLFRDIGVDELWIVFGRAKDFGLISINGLSNALGNE